MNRSLFGILLGATLCLSGCFSLEATRSEVSGEEHVWIYNNCWSLFKVIPLVSGNANGPSKFHFPTAFFRDDAKMDKVQQRMFEYAQSQHKTATDLVYHNYETVMLEIPLLGITLPIPYLLCNHEIQLSGVLK